MNIESLLITYFTNATSALQANNTLMRSNETLITSFKKVESAGTRLENTFSKTRSLAISALAAYLSFRAVSSVVGSAISFADALGNLSEALGLNIEDLSAWGDAVALNGGTSEGFQETIRSLTVSLADFATKGKSRITPFFKELKVGLTDARGRVREIFDILPDLADSFQKISKSESFGIGRKLGLDEGTIKLLQKGRKEVEAVVKQQRELGVVTKRQAELAAKYNDQLTTLKHAFRSLSLQVAESSLPTIIEFLEGFERFGSTLTRNWDKIAPILKGLGVLFAALFWPITAVAIALLLIEDALIFMEGGDSIIGEWIAEFEKLGLVAELVKLAFKGLFKFIELAIKGLIILLRDLVAHALNIPKQIENLIGNFTGIKKSMDNIFKPREMEMRLTGVNNAFNSPLKSGLAAKSSQSLISNLRTSGDKISNVNINEINIQTEATDAKEISKSLSDNLLSQIRQARNAYDDGVVA